MNLKEFIEETIVSIVAGTEDAQKKLKDIDAKYSVKGEDLVHNIKSESLVEFDIALTADETKQKGKQGSLKIATLNIGADDKKVTGNTTVSRIKFKLLISKRG